MTAIAQRPVLSGQYVDDGARQSTPRDSMAGKAVRTTEQISIPVQENTVTISLQAKNRLKAWMETMQPGQYPVLPKQGAGSPGMMIRGPNAIQKPIESSVKTGPGLRPEIQQGTDAVSETGTEQIMPDKIRQIVDEIKFSVAVDDDPGLKHLQSLLDKNKELLSDNTQLSEIIRREQFFLQRKKPFLQPEHFHSFSQVINQFAVMLNRAKASL